MIRTLKAERMKLKRSPVWLAFLIMPIVPAARAGIMCLSPGRSWMFWVRRKAEAFAGIMVLYRRGILRGEVFRICWEQIRRRPQRRRWKSYIGIAADGWNYRRIKKFLPPGMR